MQVDQPTIKVIYNNKDISEDISRSLSSFTYTDNLDEADTLDIDLEDADQKWQKDWYPEKGAKITASIGIQGGVQLNCGTFEIDEIELTGAPDAVSIRCIAAGFKEGQKRTAKNHVHENKTLKEIVNTVAKATGLTVVGNIGDVRLNRKVQQKERDLRFLHRLAREYGYTFNVRGKQLVFVKKTDLQQRPSVNILDKTDLLSFSIKDKSFATYKAASIRYHNAETGETITHTENADRDIDSDDVMELSYTAETKAQAIEMTKAALNELNNMQQSGSISLPGSDLYVAGNVIRLLGLGKMSGDYIIKQSAHQLSNDGGWITDCEVYKVNYKEDASKEKKPKGKKKKKGKKQKDDTVWTY